MNANKNPSWWGVCAFYAICAVCNQILSNPDIDDPFGKDSSMNLKVKEHVNSTNHDSYQLRFISRPLKCSICLKDSGVFWDGEMGSWVTPAIEWSYSHTLESGHVDFELAECNKYIYEIPKETSSN